MWTEKDETLSRSHNKSKLNKIKIPQGHIWKGELKNIISDQAHAVKVNDQDQKPLRSERKQWILKDMKPSRSRNKANVNKIRIPQGRIVKDELKIIRSLQGDVIKLKGKRSKSYETVIRKSIRSVQFYKIKVTWTR